MLGLPGAGKPMLARRLTTILPAMTLAEAIETTRIHRVAGRTGQVINGTSTGSFSAPMMNAMTPGERSITTVMCLISWSSVDATSSEAVLPRTA